MRSVRRALALLALVPVAASAQVVRSAAGPTAADITAARDQFRVDLGGGNVPGAAGLFSDGTGARREINWDAVPDQFASPNNLPANFFNVNSPRGAIFSTPGSGFRVSADAVNPTATPIAFGEINPTYGATFAAFSPERLFTAVGSNIVDVQFFLAGTDTPALTRGFGAIFVDVDMSGTSIEYFGLTGNSLGVFAVPGLVGSQTFSFLGVSWDDAIVSRVRIIAGTTGLGPNDGGSTDVVVMDDFLYGNPTAAAVVPEPATVLLVASGLALGALVRRRRLG
ncbi:PEP-CTERM sorting domain-containing protein [Roseisolibacter agri]|uniref:Ice-binding protein C-terminal domain-containing protein n=1 Tax=Roseisolibacter agri TaxID=2014610 RepID=A0AA37Q0N5_9BACT|nr:PEP-CTERM sorting domain-containing protein [Roseisolibacter agri]GLC24349.1 hypothetical protein rosag_08620 [Roseisolibacter agri]